MDARWGWPLAALALVAGYMQWGWQGLLFALSAVAFWLLLQFSRTIRAMKTAGEAPMGSVANAVMLQAKLRAGMPLLEVLRITGSLGRPVDGPQGDCYAWTDASQDEVRVNFRRGKVSQWALHRAPTAPDDAPTRPVDGP